VLIIEDTVIFTWMSEEKDLASEVGSLKED